MLYQGMDLTEVKEAAYKKYRMAVQIVHQDPYASLNPSHTVLDIISAPLLIHNLVPSRSAARDRVIELLRLLT